MKIMDDPSTLTQDKEGRSFREPWEAQTFALAVYLSKAGCFTWLEWTEILSQEIKSAQERGDPDLGQTYYQHWLNALERICAEKHLVDYKNMQGRLQEWRHAYLNTPHGQPVELSAALKTDQWKS